MSESPSGDIYEQSARATEGALQERLGRELSARERNSLRNAGSGMMLETIDVMLYYAKPDDDLESKLASALAGFDSRFDHFIRDLDTSFESYTGRQPSAEELSKVKSSPNLFEALRVVGRYRQAD
jgi:hypothetical protein